MVLSMYLCGLCISAVYVSLRSMYLCGLCISAFSASLRLVGFGLVVIGETAPLGAVTTSSHIY